MAVETVVQHDWFHLFTSGTLIPASVFVAISLFIIREILDGYRKSKVKKNEIRALKLIFARECQLAWYINERFKTICNQFEPFEGKPSKECPFKLSISKSAAGKLRYLITEDGSPRSSGVLAEPSLTSFTKHLYDASKLDEAFYDKVDMGYKAIIELRHFYEILVDHDDVAHLTGVDTVLSGFASFALKEMVWIEQNLKDLYQYCTDKELTKGLLR